MHIVVKVNDQYVPKKIEKTQMYKSERMGGLKKMLNVRERLRLNSNR